MSSSTHSTQSTQSQQILKLEDEDMQPGYKSEEDEQAGDEDDIMMEEVSPPQKMNLVKYEVAGNVFEVPEKYRLLNAVGQGAYGIVCSAEDTETHEKCAIKKIVRVFDRDKEFQKRILREIKVLKHFDHENIISLYDLIPPKSAAEFSDVYIVTDLLETDLKNIIKSKQPLTNSHIQYFLYQILRGVKYMHAANVLHRDLKPGNILVNSTCELKICDFGLARALDFGKPDGSLPSQSTPYVATRWYRAPELLLMWDKVSKAIDVWSIGCIFAELFLRRPLFQGSNYLHQLDLIINVLGTPADIDSVKGCDKGKNYLLSKGKIPPIPLQNIIPNAPKEGIDLLQKMLEFDPEKRITVSEALKHPFLKNLHQPDDEPDAEPFDFSFEEQLNKTNLKKSNLKAMIYKEIMDFAVKDKAQ